jgi:hypothetical protein
MRAPGANAFTAYENWTKGKLRQRAKTPRRHGSHAADIGYLVFRRAVRKMRADPSD